MARRPNRKNTLRVREELADIRSRLAIGQEPHTIKEALGLSDKVWHDRTEALKAEAESPDVLLVWAAMVARSELRKQHLMQIYARAWQSIEHLTTFDAQGRMMGQAPPFGFLNAAVGALNGMRQEDLHLVDLGQSIGTIPKEALKVDAEIGISGILEEICQAAAKRMPPDVKRQIEAQNGSRFD